MSEGEEDRAQGDDTLRKQVDLADMQTDLALPPMEASTGSVDSSRQQA